jgi:hypothetical protein
VLEGLRLRTFQQRGAASKYFSTIASKLLLIGFQFIVRETEPRRRSEGSTDIESNLKAIFAENSIYDQRCRIFSLNVGLNVSYIADIE